MVGDVEWCGLKTVTSSLEIQFSSVIIFSFWFFELYSQCSVVLTTMISISLLLISWVSSHNSNVVQYLEMIHICPRLYNIITDCLKIIDKDQVTNESILEWLSYTEIIFQLTRNVSLTISTFVTGRRIDQYR